VREPIEEGVAVVAIGPLARRAAKLGVKYGPTAAAAAKRGYEKGKPAFQGYQLAAKVDGYIATWPTPEGTVTLVLDHERSQVVGAFPRLDAAEQERALTTLDRAQMQHHTETSFHRARQKAERAADLARRPRRSS
jgi:hypothetical protein